jgi:hypothetical protein
VSRPAPPCGRPDCPVPARAPGRALRSLVWPAGTRLRRGHKRAHPDPADLVPGTGDTRFAPLVPAGADGPVRHVYVAETTFAALLESALHDAAPPAPRVRAATLGHWMESEVSLAADVRLIDLRDHELARLGIAREQLVATDAVHYRCTRAWARRLHGRAVGGRPTHGLVWQSRQTELHARALDDRPALRDLVALHPADVAVLWAPPAPGAVLVEHPGGLGPLDTGPGYEYVTNLTAELGIVVM